MSTTPSPNRIGSVLAILLSIVSLVALAWYTGLYQLVAVAALTGVIVGMAGVIGVRDSLLWTGLASLLFIGAAGLLLTGFGLATLAPAGQFVPGQSPEQLRPFVLLVSVFGATVGCTILPKQGNSDTIARSLVLTSITIAVLLGAVFILALTVLSNLVELVVPLFNFVAVPSESPENLGSLLILAGIAAIAVGALVVRLPIPALVRRERSVAVRRRLYRLYRQMFGAGVWALIVGVLMFLVMPPLWDRYSHSVTGWVLIVSTAHPIRQGLLGLIGVTGPLVVFVEVLRRLRPKSVKRATLIVAHGTGALLVIGALVVVGPESIVDLAIQLLEESTGGEAEFVDDTRDEIGGTTMVTGIAFAGPAVLSVFVCVGSLLGYLNIVSPQTAGAVLATGGTIVATIVAGLMAGSSLLLFAIVGVAIVGWNISTYSHRLNLEVGHGSARLELVRFGTVLVVALVSVGVAYGGFILTETLPSEASAAAAMAAFVGILLLTSILRTSAINP